MCSKTSANVSKNSQTLKGDLDVYGAFRCATVLFLMVCIV